MFWSVLLPLKITFSLLLFLITMVTIYRPFFNWTRKKTFFISFLIAIVLFIPSCTGVQLVVDTYRFGKFKYTSTSEIEDLRIKYTLPKKAKEITLYKSNSAHYVKYKIAKDDFILYIESLGIHKKDKITTTDDFNYWFKDINWSISKNSIKFQGAREANGSGTDYYYDLEVGIGYQWTAYW